MGSNFFLVCKLFCPENQTVTTLKPQTFNQIQKTEQFQFGIGLNQFYRKDLAKRWSLSLSWQKLSPFNSEMI